MPEVDRIALTIYTLLVVEINQNDISNIPSLFISLEDKTIPFKKEISVIIRTIMTMISSFYRCLVLPIYI